MQHRNFEKTCMTSASSEEFGYVKTNVAGVVHDGYCSLEEASKILFVQGGPPSHFFARTETKELRLPSVGL